MVSLKAIIIDDETKNRTLLQIMMEEYCKQLKIVGMTASITEGVEMTKMLKPDVVFLDIRMGGHDTGFSFFSHFSATSLPFDVVFVTAYNEFVFRAFNETPAIGYLLKPIDPDELFKIGKKLVQRFLEKTPQQILIDDIYPIHKVLYIYIKEKLLRIRLVNGTDRIATKKTLEEYEDLPDFMRINRQYILNFNHIKRVSEIDSHGNPLRGINVFLHTGDILSVAVARRSHFLKIYEQRKDM